MDNLYICVCSSRVAVIIVAVIQVVISIIRLIICGIALVRWHNGLSEHSDKVYQQTEIACGIILVSSIIFGSIQGFVMALVLLIRFRSCEELTRCRIWIGALPVLLLASILDITLGFIFDFMHVGIVIGECARVGFYFFSLWVVLKFKTQMAGYDYIDAEEEVSNDYKF